ncbi:helix-turn-helix domain-containing protein [Lentilactobacillus raoultii]|uniref:Helix-turn-helix domain-containing protein n=1 Tax=Lentilactobacillus raoultii TaxID=1987503 RepID=A0ABW3PNR7_9LACO|nr:helix-turn-helix transcriptional regulator [Lentilactobacillus raoultii]
MDISDKLRQYRKQNNLTQKELADKLHLSRKTISGWENGRGYPDIKSITQLSEIFGVSVDDLLKDDNLLEHYNEQNKQSERAEKIVKITYYLNLTLILILYCNLFDLLIINTSLFLLLLLTNLVIFFSTYSDWDRFKKNKRSLKAVIAFVVLLMVNSSVVPLNSEFFRLLAVNNQAEKLGVITGEILIILLLSICLTLIFCFYPRKQQRKRNSNNSAKN